MATLTAGTNIALDMEELDLGELRDGNAVSTSSTQIVGDIGGGYREILTGVGFTFGSDGEITGGTLTGWEETFNGATTFKATGLNQSLVQFQQWIDDDETALALGTILAGDDDVTGSALGDHLAGYGGHDAISGGAGADTLDGNQGNDHLYGESAAGGRPDGGDRIDGGGGGDYIQGNAGNDTLIGGTGSDRIQGGADGDLVTGGEGNDSINGNMGNDRIDGGGDNDHLRGGKGDDLVVGGSGDDVLLGDLGADTLEGGAGLDLLTGGADADLFRFAAGDAAFGTVGVSAYVVDTIADYADGTDRLALGFAPAAVLGGAAQGSAAAALAQAQQLLDGRAGNGEVAAVQVGSDTYLFWNGTGGAVVDSAARLIGVSSGVLGLSDFG